MTVTLQEQVECVERELKYRRRVYDRRVSEGKMKQELADRELARMAAVLETVRAAAMAQPLLAGPTTKLNPAEPWPFPATNNGRSPNQALPDAVAATTVGEPPAPTPEQMAAAIERACRRLYADQFTGDAPLLMAAAAELRAPTQPLAWAYYWPDGGLCRVETSRCIDQASQHRWREVPLYAAPPAGQEGVTLWREVALRVGEELADTGPPGYYDMTAGEWREWALGVLAAAPGKGEK